MSYQTHQPKTGYRDDNLYRGDNGGGRYSCSSTRGAERIQHAPSPYQEDKALVLHSRLGDRLYSSPSRTRLEEGRSSQMMATTPAYPSSQQHQQPNSDLAALQRSMLSGNPRSARSSLSHRSSGSSVSPSESASRISSRSSRYSSSSGSGSSGGRDDPQLLYEYVAQHLQYGEHEGVVWNRGTNSYVMVVGPRC
ncbi:hypothetical protein LTR57_021547 [Friedmanniomyces endolithicus]|nr:hypothetical protein LTR75_015436 [Friedmanniomyces endolithicus]KAK0843032.1 hypothetical protein LTS02_016244 [Friedmanniomyces endolithicus]KAK0898620.1 hypothetical protein LTR57_021547 [Friedmanniomyces endolithicus]KAK0997106.1 hypothetical protein LTS01_006089 [Friedmanniomyces endolithicus]KAK1046356.1 hypothetical protein LTR33_015088 [Friedmanniomyces endolithicus]